MGGTEVEAGLIDWNAQAPSSQLPCHAHWLPGASTGRLARLLHLHVTSDDGTQLPAASGTAIIPPATISRAGGCLGRNQHLPAGDELSRAPFLPIIATYPLDFHLQPPLHEHPSVTANRRR